jgi:hypothetical protein
MRFYRSVLKRHLYVVGPEKQLLSKNPSFTPCLRSLAETFPDGRFICCVREPVEVVPSLLSSVGTGGRLFGYDVAEPRIRDRFVGMLEFFAKHALETLSETANDRHAFAPLREMRNDVGGFVLGIYHRFGWSPDPEFRNRLAEEARRGRSYTSRHTYSLAEFGLEEEDIRGRFQELNERFGFGKSLAGEASPGEKPG